MKKVKIQLFFHTIAFLTFSKTEIHFDRAEEN